MALTFVGTCGLAGATSGTASSGKISARLTKTSFKPAQAGSVKLIYKFSRASKRFSYLLSFKQGAKWQTVKRVKKTGKFKGSKSMTIKKVFAGKAVKIGSYRLKLSADKGSKLLRFKVVNVAKAPSAGAPSTGSASPPSGPVKLIFIHHSTGSAWLSDGKGALGIALRNNGYFVSDTNYHWGPDAVGDMTDIGQWWTWFRGPSSSTYTAALYDEFGQHASYSRLAADPDPTRENQVVMFKSCFPNSNISGKPGDPATTGNNPLRGKGATAATMTVANVKGIYNDILTYFAAHQDKLFVLIVPPPLVSTATDTTRAANARAVANWLVRDWLKGYGHNNVAVFDFYNVLTSNAGSADVNDLGAADGNHHRLRDGAVQHSQTVSSNFLAYPTGDSHPTRAGHLKATGEFVDLLNYYYQRWAAT